MQKNILITGVTRGLGRALALHFAHSGHNVWGVGRNHETIAELASIGFNNTFFKVVDVSDDGAVKRWADEIITAGLNKIDILINNAGVMNTPAPIWMIKQCDFDAIIDINVKGTANVLRHFVPHMVKLQTGNIVNFISGSGRNCPSDSGAYNASKWAIEAITRTLANEIPTGMAAIALNPGTINTDMLRTIIGERASNFPEVDRWVKKAADLILSFSPEHNGEVLSVNM
ncbi:MAG TPA: SDR family oxidoreductase [Oligoflexia bacterium]|nr:SDR family oxidoreductase [Oligoflexia bacterium]HMP48592.1 SDR family oxidoreductase [Oligoflexia bacterium]